MHPPQRWCTEKSNKLASSSEDFELPFAGKLSADNPWVQLAQLIPWSEFEEKYAQNFGAEVGPPVKSFRLALVVSGLFIIKIYRTADEIKNTLILSSA